MTLALTALTVRAKKSAAHSNNLHWFDQSPVKMGGRKHVRLLLASNMKFKDEFVKSHITQQSILSNFWFGRVPFSLDWSELSLTGRSGKMESTPRFIWLNGSIILIRAETERYDSYPFSFENATFSLRIHGFRSYVSVENDQWKRNFSKTLFSRLRVDRLKRNFRKR